MQELRKVSELAAKTSDAEQETARQCSQHFDSDIAKNVQRAKAAQAEHLAEQAHATARSVLVSCDKHLIAITDLKA